MSSSYVLRKPKSPYFPLRILTSRISGAAAMRAALEFSGCPMSDYAKSMLAGISDAEYSARDECVALAACECREIGVTGPVDYNALVALIDESRYFLAPRRVAPWMRMQYSMQPPGEELTVITEQIEVKSCNYTGIFRLVHETEQCLRTVATIGTVWQPSDVIVLMISRHNL